MFPMRERHVMMGIKFLWGKNTSNPVELAQPTTCAAGHLLQWWFPLNE